MNETKSAVLEHSYLIQRLSTSHSQDGKGTLLEAFSFGGGYKNGGLSEEAMQLLRPLFSFEYMGSAEFEFGAVPEALSKIANWGHDGELVFTGFDIDLDDVPYPPFLDGEPRTGLQTVYVISHKLHALELVGRLKRLMTTEPFSSEWPHMKEQPSFDRALHRAFKHGNPTIGWLELDNGWFAFIDEEVAQGVAKLFGVEVEDE